MSPFEEARQLLPFWVIWGNLLLFLPFIALVSFVSLRCGLAVVLQARRLSSDLSWPERARWAYPVRVATSLSTPLLVLLAVLLALIHAGPLGHVAPAALVPCAGLAAYAPCGLIRLRLERRLQRTPLGALRWFGGILLSWLILFPFIFLVPLVIFVSTE